MITKPLAGSPVVSYAAIAFATLVAGLAGVAWAIPVLKEYSISHPDSAILAGAVFFSAHQLAITLIRLAARLAGYRLSNWAR